MKRKKVFYLKMDGKWFKRGDILKADSSGLLLEVVKYCEMTKWKKFINWLGFPVRIGEYKVKLKSK